MLGPDGEDGGEVRGLAGARAHCDGRGDTYSELGDIGVVGHGSGWGIGATAADAAAAHAYGGVGGGASGGPGDDEHARGDSRTDAAELAAVGAGEGGGGCRTAE